MSTTIYFNHQVLKIPQNISLQEVLTMQEIENNCYAIAINRQFVSRAHYASTFLKEGDHIELISPMQGG